MDILHFVRTYANILMKDDFLREDFLRDAQLSIFPVFFLVFTVIFVDIS